MRRWTTSLGGAVTADTRAAAAALAAQYGLGEIVAQVATPSRQRPPMKIGRAVALYERAHEWPRCGQDWPDGADEREAARVLFDEGYEP